MNPKRMRAGKQTGSLVNHLQSGNTSDAPAVGMGATVLHWTDRSAATIVAVISEDVVEITDDTATRTDKNGMSESQEYSFVSNLDGARRLFKRDRNGAWRSAHRNERGRVVFTDPAGGGNRLLIGQRDHYHDFSF